MTALIRARRPWLVAALACALTLAAAQTIAQTAAPTPAAPPSGAPDFSGYQKLLDEFLMVLSGPGEPLETGFQYTALFVQLDRNARLNAVRSQLLSVKPSSLGPAEREAWAINTYNFLALETATDHRFVGPSTLSAQKSAYVVRRKNVGVQEIRLPMGKFYESPVAEIEGVEYSLDQFERHFLFDDSPRVSGNPPPASIDPRIHFALVGATRGGPALMPRAFTAESLDAQLDLAAREALASPRHLQWSDERGMLMGSVLMRWNSSDFGGSAGVIAFVKRYAPPALQQLIADRKVPWVSGLLPYDWGFNEPPPNAQPASEKSGPRNAGSTPDPKKGGS